MEKISKAFYEATKFVPGEPTPFKEYPTSWDKVFYKQYPRLDHVRLTPTAIRGEISDLLASRSSEDMFSDEPVSLEHVSNFLCHALGKRKNGRRPYPSSGARYPVETYPVVFRGKDLDPGAYHFDVLGNRLDVLLRENLLDRRDEITSKFVTNAPLAFVLTTVISRSEVKYQTNALRFSMIEAGHMVQNMALVAESMRLKGRPIIGYVDETIEDILDLTDKEFPLYVFVCGRSRKARRKDLVSYDHNFL